MLQYYGDQMAIPPQVIVQQDDRGGSRGRSARCSASAAAPRVEVRAAERGDKRRILELAERNARLALDQEKLKAERRRQQRVEALDGLQEALGARRAAAADRVLRHLEPDGHAHRRVDGRLRGRRAEEVRLPALQRSAGSRTGVPDDFAAMEEVLGAPPRRSGRRQQDLSPHDPKRNESFATLPNLIVIDGGKGQLARGPAGARGLPRARAWRSSRWPSASRRSSCPGRREPIVLGARHARAAAAAARPRRGAPLRDHPPPHAPRPRDDRVDPRRAARRRPGAQARAAQALRLARGGRSPRPARSSRRVPGLPGQDRARPLRPPEPDGRITRRSPTMSEADDTLPDMATRPSRRQRLKFGRRDRDATTGESVVAPRRRRGRRSPDRPRPAARRCTPSRGSRTSSSSPASRAPGKSTAMNVFEDAGYFCVDNLPPEMIRALVELFVHEGSKVERAAVVSDVRGGDYFEALRGGARRPRARWACATACCSSTPTSRRCSPATRRPAAAIPLAPGRASTQGIAAERELLEPVKERADVVIDTTGLKAHMLRRKIADEFLPRAPATRLAVTFESFGFKHGPPRDADLVFDVRFLPNPHYEPDAAPADRPRPAGRRRTSSRDGQLDEFYERARSRCSTSCSRSTWPRARRTSRSRSAAPAAATARSRSPSTSARRYARARRRARRGRAPRRRPGERLRRRGPLRHDDRVRPGGPGVGNGRRRGAAAPESGDAPAADAHGGTDRPTG